MCFKEVSRKFKGFSRKFKGCFKGVLRVFQGHYRSFMSVSRLFQGSLKHIESLCFVVVVVAASRAEGGLVYHRNRNEAIFEGIFFIEIKTKDVRNSIFCPPLQYTPPPLGVYDTFP